MMTKSSNFASAVKVSFHEYQEWIECKFPHYGICTTCAALVISERQSDIFRVEMIIQMVHVQLLNTGEIIPLISLGKQFGEYSLMQVTLHLIIHF